MSVSYVGNGTGVDSSTSSISLGTPGGTAPTAGNLILTFLAWWDPNRTLPVCTSSGFQLVGSTLSTGGGGGTYGLDAGPRDTCAYWKVSDGTETSVAFTLADGDAGAGARGYCYTYSKTLNKWATPISVAGEDSASGVTYSVTAASDFGGAGSVNGDMLAISVTSCPDNQNHATPLCTYAGSTVVTAPANSSGAATAGHDGRHNTYYQGVTGTSSGAPVWTSTVTTATGTALFVRLRDLDEIARPSLAQIQAVGRSVL